jgi:Lrp/AsnC family leucine-responsive transcriptional regulator
MVFFFSGLEGHLQYDHSGKRIVSQNGILDMAIVRKNEAAVGTSRRKQKDQIDETDRRILRELQKDARLTTSQLADRIGLSTTPCWNRIKRLETQGFIDGYVALLNQEKLGLPETVIIEVTLDRHDEDVLRRFGELLAEMPEVIEAYLTTGDYDYLVKVAVESTAGYERFLREKLYRLPGVRHTRSSFALRCLKKLNSVQV